MTTFFDTSVPGSTGPLVASGQVFYFGAETDFYLSVASNLIAGQATGPSVQFSIQSRRTGKTDIQVDYGTTNTQFSVKYTGYMIMATVPAGGNPVSCRVVVSDAPFPLTVITVPAVGTFSGVVSVTGTVATDVGQGTAPSPGVNTTAVAEGGSTAPAATSGTLTFTGTDSTQTFATGPPPNKRWRLWGFLVEISNTSGAVLLVFSSIGVIITQTIPGFKPGVYWSKTETWGLSPGTEAIFGVIPVGMTGVNGIAMSDIDYLAAWPFEIVLEPTLTISAAITARSASTSTTATVTVIPLGIEEPL
jgi:hypothetical protein